MDAGGSSRPQPTSRSLVGAGAAADASGDQVEPVRGAEAKDDVDEAAEGGAREYDTPPPRLLEYESVPSGWDRRYEYNRDRTCAAVVVAGRGRALRRGMR